MQLYSFFNSSTSYRVRIALALKGLDYTYQGINIRVGEQRSADYQALNPSQGVPLLVADNGTAISQSLAIIAYLDDVYPGPKLIPEELLAKTRVLELANAIACDMHPVNNLRILGYLKNELGIDEQQKTTWYNHWISEGFAAVEALLSRHGHGQYCFGDAPTLADCCLVPQVANAQRMGCDLSPYPKVMAVYRYCQQQPAFRQAAPGEQPDFIG
ncbi:maleylacetoacetate isomerase [Zobellella aerophila]|uniref:Maleylacetoacetate isomerase n=1 Tax=Zobellella aerophila TaxID=870480 RepID=A0ABP6VQB7_9GAMM